MLQHKYAEVNNIRLHYVTTGQGKLIMFAHGFPEFWYAWKKQLVEFGQDYQAVALDMRGYNLSSKPAGVAAYQMRRLVEDLRALADHLGQQRFTLIAHDWGGAVAWVFAAMLPHYLEKLIIINAPHPAIFARELRQSPAQQEASRYMLSFRSPEAETTLAANDYARLVEVVLAEGLEKGYFTETDQRAYIDAWSQPGALSGGLNYYRASSLHPAGADHQGAEMVTIDPAALMVNVPTLVIWGEKDTALLRSNLEGLEDLVPNLTIKRIPEGSHWVIHEYPGLVNGYIRGFIEET